MGPVGMGASYRTCQAIECSTQLIATCRGLITTTYHKNLRLGEVMLSRGGHTAGQRQGQSWSRSQPRLPTQLEAAAASPCCSAPTWTSLAQWL